MNAAGGRGAVRMPMFPLGSVLLPHDVLPLHVFEPRYRAMVQWCLDADGGPRFGVVLIARGHEVGGGDERHDVGVVARIVRHEQAPDGRYGLLCIGEERIRVVSWLPDEPFPLAMVEPMPEVPAEPAGFTAAAPGVVEAARELHRLLGELAARAGHEVPEPPGVLDAAVDELDDDARRTWFSYAVAASVPLGAADRLRVLGAPGAVERLAVLGEVIDDAMSTVPAPARVVDSSPMARTDDLSIIELVKAYAEQETLGRVKGAGRWLAYGAAGSTLLGVGIVLLLLGGLRFVQTTWDTTFDGAWSWVPYAFVVVAAVLVLVLALSRVKKATLTKEPS